MRFARLELARYGHLTDVALDLTDGRPDFHIVVGANEAGKSTTRAAIADLLFGFGHKTDYAFLHHERDLRVGALLEDGTRRLEAWRRKGRKDTLRGAGDAPLDEPALAAFLHGVTRETFLARFSLDHERLRAGGQAILEEKDDLGRLLFQAGAGLDLLVRRLSALEDHARKLFVPRGSAQAVTEALRRRAEALRRVKDATGSAREFQEAERAERAATEDLKRSHATLADLRARRGFLTRAQRAIPLLRVMSRLEAAILAEAGAPDLPAGYGNLLRAAAEAETAARRAATAARDELARAEAALAPLTPDLAVLGRGDEIDRLPDRIGAVLSAAEHLPRREAELDACEDVLSQLLREVGHPELPPAAAGDHLPTREDMATLRRLAGEHARLSQALEAAQAAQDASRRALTRARATLEAVPPPRDARALTEALRDARRHSPEPLRRARDEAAKHRDALERRLATLSPPAPDGVARSALPAAAAVSAFDTEWKAMGERLAETRREAERIGTDRARLAAERDSLLAGEGAVPAETLRDARQRRDRGWRLVRRTLEHDAPDPDELRDFGGGAPLVSSVEAAIAEADRLADRRFETAETCAKLSQLTATLAGRDAEAADAERRIAAAEAERTALRERWRAAWSAARIEPGTPADMLPWLTRLEDIETARRDLADAERRADALAAAEAALAVRLAATLTTFGQAPTAGASLPALLEAAETLNGTLAERERERKSAAATLAIRQDEADAADDGREAAAAALERWLGAWIGAMARHGRPADSAPADLEPWLAAWDAIRNKDAEARGLRGRIRDMRANDAAFAANVRALARNLGEAPLVAPATADRANDDRPPVEAARALVERLARARADRDRQTERQKEVESRRAALDRAEAAERKAIQALDDRLAPTGAASLDEARPLVERAEERARLGRELASARATLAEAGDGRSEAEMRAECDPLDPDALAGEIEEIGAHETRLLADIQRLSADQGAALGTLKGFRRAGSTAAEAAEEAAGAAAEAARAAERYIQAKASAVLLRHAIDRYRKENEGPLLARAGALFATLTVGRYQRLIVDHDGDKPQLLARPAEGPAPVPVEGLSDGTRDQLFLALRLAAVERTLDDGTVLPFVADDLFVNFDDARAAAGLQVLADLGQRTQVLLFTHHRHLAELAARHIPGRFAVPAPYIDAPRVPDGRADERNG